MGRFTRRTNRGGPSGPFLEWPLSVSSNGRHLTKPDGTPFFVHGDTPWSIEVQLTHAQVDTYLNDRAAKGFTALLFEAMEHLFSSQTPPWRNAQSGVDPFTTTTASSCSWTSRVESYWQTVDYIVAGAKSRGMACFITPAYLGFGGGAGGSGDQGWNGAVVNANAADLQAYGAFLAQRYGQGYGNVVWVMGGDYAGTQAERDKQWNIATGIRSVTPNALITGHPQRSDAEAHPFWNGYTGFNLNCTYGGQGAAEHDLATTAYGRAGPLPFFFIEGDYEDDGAALAEIRRQAYESLLSGACGHFYGKSILWGFGEPNANGGLGAANALANHLDVTGAQQMAHLKSLFAAYQWWKLEPKRDTSLVSSSLGTGSTRICPARASDGSFAFIWVPTSQTPTVVMSALAPSSVRARLYDPTTGSYSTVSGSPFANTGTQNIATGGERVIVLDAA